MFSGVWGLDVLQCDKGVPSHTHVGLCCLFTAFIKKEDHLALTACKIPQLLAFLAFLSWCIGGGQGNLFRTHSFIHASIVANATFSFLFTWHRGWLVLCLLLTGHEGEEGGSELSEEGEEWEVLESEGLGYGTSPCRPQEAQVGMGMGSRCGRCSCVCLDGGGGGECAGVGMGVVILCVYRTNFISRD